MAHSCCRGSPHVQEPLTEFIPKARLAAENRPYPIPTFQRRIPSPKQRTTVRHSLLVGQEGQYVLLYQP